MPDLNLTPEERERYDGNAIHIKRWHPDDCSELCEEQGFLEALSACRGLLDDAKLYLQSYEMASEREGFKGTPHHDGIKKMIVAIAAQLKGIGGE